MCHVISEDYIKKAIDKYSDTIVRIAFGYTKNRADSEDLIQEVFLSLLKKGCFESEEHLKAWLIRVTINKSKNLIKSLKSRPLPLNEARFVFSEEQSQVLSELNKLSASDRDIIYLFYFEGYSANEIAGILGKKENAVFTALSRARERLKKYLEEE